jgi:hypothetical protein
VATLRLVLCVDARRIASPSHTVPFLKALDADLWTLIALVAGPMDAGRSGYWSLDAGLWALSIRRRRLINVQIMIRSVRQRNSQIMNSPQGKYRASAIKRFT